MSDDIPGWAVDRVQEMLRGDWGSGCHASSSVVQTFARYIAEHEEPPVDPLVAAVCAATDFDNIDEARKFAAELRAQLAHEGLEIREVQS